MIVDMTQVEKLILDPDFQGVATKLQTTEELNSSLIAASREGDIDRVKELIAQGADVNAQNEYGETALMTSAKIGHIVCLEQLLENSDPLNMTDSQGNTALIHAIPGRKIECIKKLITAGADVNIGTVPPLICSIRSKCFDSVNELLKVGADVNAKDANKNTALIEAVCCGKNTIVQSLLLKGAEVNAENRTVTKQSI